MTQKLCPLYSFNCFIFISFETCTCV